LDAGKSGIFAWIGKQCSKDEKLQAMKHAEKFLVEKGYPQWTKVQEDNFWTSTIVILQNLMTIPYLTIDSTSC